MKHRRPTGLTVVLFVAISLGFGTAAGGQAVERSDSILSLVSLDRGVLEASLSEFERAQDTGRIRAAWQTEETVLLYAGSAGLELLKSLAAEHAVLLESVADKELYIIPKTEDVHLSDFEPYCEILDGSGSFFLVAVSADEAFRIHLLPFKKRLPEPSRAGPPLRLSGARMVPRSAEPLSYDPMIQDMVDSVSENRLYSLLCDLTGENPVTIGGETYTINTRYSPNSMCRRAGRFLRERFEAMGIQAEYHYFNFRTSMKAVLFPENQMEGWAVGKQMLVLHTEDGGETWYEQHWGDEGGLNDISMWTATRGCAVGNNAVILITEDGYTWQRVTSPVAVDLKAVTFVDPVTVYCCGDDGTVLKSVDAAQTWFALGTGTTRDLRGIHFVDTEVGWAVGAGGRIIKTENAGSSWSIVSSPVGNDLTDVTFYDDASGWISGTDGTILRTDDGQTWQDVSTPVSTHLQSVFFIDGSVGWACGFDGAFIKSVDGGVSWSDLSFSTPCDRADVFFTDTADGWVAGLATVQHTQNGGADWEDKRDGVYSGDVNVVATIPGTTRPDDIYIICGHYDSISEIPNTYAPGADDNGTGAVSTVEAASILRNYAFEGTLRFVCFSREEQGLVGSHAYASDAYDRGDQIIGALNFDMIGYEDVHPEDVDVLYNDISGWLANAYDDAAALYVPGLAVIKKYATYVGSDNSSFWDYGYPSFCGIEDVPLNNPQYHRTADQVSTVDFEFYADVVKAGVATLAELAGVDTASSSVTAAFEPAGLKIGPVPSRDQVTIEMSVRAGSPEFFDVHDVTGRLVARIKPSNTSAGTRAVWDGTDASGRRVGPGIYFVRVAGRSGGAKVVLLR
jgi:photosystem II stability/assembly factor-like uncharacterized protein